MAVYAANKHFLPLHLFSFYSYHGESGYSKRNKIQVTWTMLFSTQASKLMWEEKGVGGGLKHGFDFNTMSVLRILYLTRGGFEVGETWNATATVTRIGLSA